MSSRPELLFVDQHEVDLVVCGENVKSFTSLFVKLQIDWKWMQRLKCIMT